MGTIVDILIHFTIINLALLSIESHQTIFAKELNTSFSSKQICDIWSHKI